MVVRPQSRTFWKRGVLALSLAVVGIATVVAILPAASADTRSCRKLEAQLAAASRGGSSAKTRKYDAAIARQRSELQKARSHASQSGCILGFLGGEQCASLKLGIGRMEDNLASLQRTRDKLGGGSSREKTRLIAAIDRAGCRDQQTASRGALQPLGQRERGASLLDQILGRKPPAGLPKDDGLGDVIDRSGEQRISRVLRPDGGLPKPTASFRTFCVRTCDGYFFPMSPASSPDDLPRDQQNCESACPGTDMRVYFRTDAGDDPSALMSVADDAPYTDLPAAFAYRRNAGSNPQCGCKASTRSLSVVSTAPATDAEPVAPQQATEATQTSSSVVVLQPPTANGPANSTDEDAVQRLLRADAERDGGSRRVRVVGPAFLPDPEGAIDLRSPAHGPAP